MWQSVRKCDKVLRSAKLCEVFELSLPIQSLLRFFLLRSTLNNCPKRRDRTNIHGDSILRSSWIHHEITVWQQRSRVLWDCKTHSTPRPRCVVFTIQQLIHYSDHYYIDYYYHYCMCTCIHYYIDSISGSNARSTHRPRCAGIDFLWESLYTI